jgi:hypothetical protein
MLSQTIEAGTTTIATQTYAYGGMIRLWVASEAGSWSQTSSYDQFGTGG